MEYTQSSMPKLVEAYLLLKQNFAATKQQAQRLHATYSRINQEFQIHDSHVLELGAGSRGALIQLFDDSNEVVGIDLYLGALDQGVWKAAKTYFRKIVFDPLFHHYVKMFNGRPVNKNRKVLHMDATNLDFPDNSFDFVYSRYFLEHIDDINRIASECFRVLKPGGTAYHVLALYTSLDGAHTLDWRRYDPWQHLITEVQGNAYINKYRLEKYRQEFESVFGAENVTLRVERSDEAVKLLTLGRRQILADYAEDELLATSPEVIARKPGN